MQRIFQVVLHKTDGTDGHKKAYFSRQNFIVAAPNDDTYFDNYSEAAAAARRARLQDNSGRFVTVEEC